LTNKPKITYYFQIPCSFCDVLAPHLRVFLSVVDVDFEEIVVTGNFSLIKDAGGTVTPHLTLDTDDGRFVLEERRVAALIQEYKEILAYNQ
jgi:hypothetical protein